MAERRRSNRPGRGQIDRFQPPENFHGGDNADDMEPDRQPRRRRLERDLPANGDGGGGEGAERRRSNRRGAGEIDRFQPPENARQPRRDGDGGGEGMFMAG